jgi:hypothetical protein
MKSIPSEERRLAECCQGNAQECRGELQADSSLRKPGAARKSPAGDTQAVTTIRKDRSLLFLEISSYDVFLAARDLEGVAP